MKNIQIKGTDKSLLLIGLLNFLLFQWFFVRLALNVDPPIKDYVTKRRPLYLLKWVVPLSGWFGIPFFPRSYKMVLLLSGIEVCIAPYVRKGFD
jgi:hypothetical protein